MTTLFSEKFHYAINVLQDDENPKKNSANSPSNARKIPVDWLPTHFLSRLANGPAADDQHPLWLPETGKAVIKLKTDILDTTASSTSMGRSSLYSRKSQRLDGAHSSNTTVLDLTKGDEVSNGLLRESVKNSAQIISLLKGATDYERQTVDALVQNAHRMYELDSTQENKADYVRALQKQKDLLVLRSVNTLDRNKERGISPADEDYSDDFLFDATHSLDDSFAHESLCDQTPNSL